MATGSPTLLISAALTIQSLFGSATPPEPYRATPVRRYVELFETESILHRHMTLIPSGFKVSFMTNESIPITGGDRCLVPYRVIGYCYKTAVGPPVIVIDREYFDDAPEEERISLVFHELGHCLLDRLHEDRMEMKGGKLLPISLMRSSMEPGDHFWRYLDYYFDELFQGENRDPSIW